MSNNMLKGTVYTLIAAIGFGATAPIAKIIYSYGITPSFMLTLRFFIASIILWIYILINRKKIEFSITKKQGFELFFIGSVVYFFTTFFYFNAIRFIPISLHVIVFYTYPLIVNIFSFLILKEKFSFKQFMALFLGFIGIVVIVFVPNLEIKVIGLVLSFLAALSNSIYVLMIARKNIKKLSSVVIAGYTNLFSSISFFIYSYFKGEINFNLNYRIWIGVLIIAIFSTVISIIALSSGIKLIGPSKASIICTFEPIEGVLLSLIFLGEKLVLNQGIGIVMVMLGIIIINLKNNGEKLNNYI